MKTHQRRRISFIKNGDWGIGDWGLGIGDSPIPNPHFEIYITFRRIHI
jgi:hypothetical protein